MTIFKAIILGIIQGVAEFLPISSSAHLIVFPYLFGWEESSLRIGGIYLLEPLKI